MTNSVTYQEQLEELQTKLETLNHQITRDQELLLANSNHQPTISRYNIQRQRKIETLTKIRGVKKNIIRKVCQNGSHHLPL